MNNVRRKELDMILLVLNSLKDDLESVLDEEREAFENIPENLWGSERYEKSRSFCFVS